MGLVIFMEGITAFYCLHKNLGVPFSNRSDNDAPVVELVDQRLGNIRRGRGYQNAVKRGMFRGAKGTVRGQDGDILIPQRGQSP